MLMLFLMLLLFIIIIYVIFATWSWNSITKHKSIRMKCVVYVVTDIFLIFLCFFFFFSLPSYPFGCLEKFYFYYFFSVVSLSIFLMYCSWNWVDLQKIIINLCSFLYVFLFFSLYVSYVWFDLKGYGNTIDQKSIRYILHKNIVYNFT